MAALINFIRILLENTYIFNCDLIATDNALSSRFVFKKLVQYFGLSKLLSLSYEPRLMVNSVSCLV
jgi:hypothetical protein